MLWIESFCVCVFLFCVVSENQTSEGYSFFLHWKTTLFGKPKISKYVLRILKHRNNNFLFANLCQGQEIELFEI